MASEDTFYGSVKEELFVLIHPTTGNRVIGHTFVVGDAYLQPPDGSAEIAVHGEMTAVGTRGLYKWTPSIAARLQYHTASVLLQSASGAFQDNTLTLKTGGDDNAFYNAKVSA